MIVKAFGALLIKNILRAQEEIVENAAKEMAINELKEKARRYFLAHVAKTYADEYKYNTEAYVKSLELMELEIDLPQIEINNLVYKFQATLSNFENIFEQKLPQEISTQLVLDKLGAKPMSKIYGGGLAPPQLSPTMAFVNKNISKPMAYQPYILQKEQTDLVLDEAQKIWEELLENELNF